MARQPRFFAPGQPLHIVQRGNNRSAIFRQPKDRRIFLRCMVEAAREHRLLVHAYVLMTNHWHMLATPSVDDSVSKTVQSVGRQYVQRFNLRYERTGTLWEGRYRASIVHSEAYLFMCMRYIELNPVRAGIARTPAEYAWSSYAANAEGAADPLITPHPLYDGLAPTDSERMRTYRSLFGTPLSAPELNAIREATNRNWALGDDRFRLTVEDLCGRRASPLRPGRRKINDLEIRV